MARAGRGEPLGPAVPGIDSVDRIGILREICERYRLRAMYLFGSRAGEMAAWLRGAAVGKQLPSSDLDVGILPDRGGKFTTEARVRLAVELEDFFGAERVDLVLLPEAPPFLAVEVIAGECIYCQDQDEVAEYELYVLRRAGDFEPLQRDRLRATLGLE